MFMPRLGRTSPISRFMTFKAIIDLIVMAGFHHLSDAFGHHYRSGLEEAHELTSSIETIVLPFSGRIIDSEPSFQVNLGTVISSQSFSITASM